jgi:DNA-binding XRE family transcriptional regulator
VSKPQTRLAYRFLPTALAELRIAAGFTQRDLAAKLKVAQNTVYRMEVGSRRCDAIELIQWARACGADPVETFVSIVRQVK